MNYKVGKRVRHSHARRLWKKINALPRRISIPAGLIIVGVLCLVIYGVTKNGDDTKVVYQADKPEVTASGVNNFPKDAQSSICNALSNDDISNAIREPIKEQKVGIPDTKTDTGSVTSCGYIVDKRPEQQLRSINVTKTTFKASDEARKSFDNRSKNAKKIDGLGDAAAIIEGSNQLIVVRSNELLSITLSKFKSDATNTEDKLQAVAKSAIDKLRPKQE